MAHKEDELILWRTEHSMVTLHDLANATGAHPELVAIFVDYGLIEPSADMNARPLFPVASIERLECIMRLRRDLGVNLAGVGVILEMRERIERLQEELETLRSRLRMAE
jgi:MerR family transcriptional regulator/heat shock protein HspR